MNALFLTVAGSIMLSGCALYTQTSFTEYRGPSEFTGRGGTVKTVEGIEVWTSGEPNRRFSVRGVVDQSYYHNHSVMSLIAGTTKNSAMIATAKKYGGDAIIFLGSDSVVTGYTTKSYAFGGSTGTYSGNYGGGTYSGTYSGNSSGYGTAHTHVNTQTATSVAVIKYLD